MKTAIVSFLSATALCSFAAAPAWAQSTAVPQEGETQVLDELRVLDTAAVQARQALGTSIITAEDIEKRPPVNDLADIIRREPGINLTNAGASGSYGNNRQIDIRGMGPENTFILIDGKPVQSRGSVFMGRNGERNTRGDTNWVPANEVERIEILRGPAAARYGSGAAGGVINIITKGPSNEFRGSATGYVQQPSDSLESNTARVNATLSGPIIKDVMSFRIYGNYNVTSADDPSLNAEAADTTTGLPPAGREGVTNKDVSGMIRLTPAQGQRIDLEAGFSRQGNEYNGEVLFGNGGAGAQAALGLETNTMKRTTASANYQGDFTFGTAKLVAQFEKTNNRRLNEGQAGSGEGSIQLPLTFSDGKTRNWYVNGSLDVPFSTGSITHVVTGGAEYRNEYLYDSRNVGNEITITNPSFDLTGYLNGDPEARSEIKALYIESNSIWGPVTVTPMLRYDHHNDFGGNWSPGISISYAPIPDLTIKGGIARAFKAPNLYQSNPNFLYSTRGNGCPSGYSQCRILGNPNLKPETSVNKEIGVAYAPKGFNISATYFRNDYSDKIVTSPIRLGTGIFNGTVVNIFQWDNAPKAIVEGLEGNLMIRILKNLRFNTNVTYMIQNKNQTTGAKLSVIPEYTINSTLEWDISDQVNILAMFTRYGKQEPNMVTWSGTTTTGDATRARDPYNLVGINANFRVNDNFRMGMGVSNLFNKRLFREDSSSGAGANNFNEPGRAYFVTTTVSF